MRRAAGKRALPGRADFCAAAAAALQPPGGPGPTSSFETRARNSERAPQDEVGAKAVPRLASRIGAASWTRPPGQRELAGLLPFWPNEPNPELAKTNPTGKIGQNEPNPQNCQNEPNPESSMLAKQGSRALSRARSRRPGLRPPLNSLVKQPHTTLRRRSRSFFLSLAARETWRGGTLSRADAPLNRLRHHGRLQRVCVHDMFLTPLLSRTIF